MIVRLLLAITVTAALLGASWPAVDSARVDHADATVTRQLDTLSERLRAMVVTDDPATGPGARLRAEIRLPHRQLTSARIAALSLVRDNGTTVARWRVGDAGRTRRTLLDYPLVAPGGRLTLRAAGTHRLVFGYRVAKGRPVVTVRRFKSDAAPTTGYA